MLLFVSAPIFLCCLDFALGASLVQVTSFGNNPSGIQMFEYVPAKVSTRPSLLVAIHWCGGSASAMFSGSKYAALADTYGFIVVYPSATRSSKCWDVYSAKGLKRNGGSDSQGIVSMVQYEISKRGVNASRVFVTGLSSGAMMTNVLLAEYPDLFSAGAAFAGVPYGCFATTGDSTWNSTCAQGKVSQTPAQWGNLVRSAFPGYSGKRPRMMLLHGTKDDTLLFSNLQQEVNQWTNVLGVSQTASFADSPNVGISGVTATRRRYGGTGAQAPVEALTLTNGVHFLSMGGTLADMAARFMGLIP